MSRGEIDSVKAAGFRTHRLVGASLIIFGAIILFVTTINAAPAAPAPASSFEQTLTFPSIDEVRLGAFDQNIEGSGNEAGIAINAEILFGRPFSQFNNGALDFLFRPRPHIGVSINTGGYTSEYYFGNTWDIALTDWAFFEVSLGGAVHDGPLDEAGKASYGCRVSFRESASLGFAMSEKLRLIFTIDHMSNANLCDRNRGLTNAGVRIGYKLN